MLKWICAMALNAKTKKECDFKMHQWAWKTALNAETKEEGDFKMHEWAWRMALNAKLRKIVNQNAWMCTKNSSKCQN